MYDSMSVTVELQPITQMDNQEDFTKRYKMSKKLVSLKGTYVHLLWQSTQPRNTPPRPPHNVFLLFSTEKFAFFLFLLRSKIESIPPRNELKNFRLWNVGNTPKVPHLKTKVPKTLIRIWQLQKRQKLKSVLFFLYCHSPL